MAGHVSTTHGLHSEFFALDERVLQLGAAVEALFAIQALRELNSPLNKHDNDEL